MKSKVIFSALLLSVSLTRTGAQGTSAFTYQGRLDTTNGPASGLYDFRCQLYNDQNFGSLVSTTVTNAAVPVTNGLFVLNLDFGTSVFDGGDRWLSLDVRTNNALNFSHVSPLQHLTPTPYALYSRTAGSLSAGVNQTFTGSVSFNPAGGPPFNVGSSTKVPNLNADLLDGLDSNAFVLKAGDTMSGNLTVANPATLNFGSSVRQMINLWGTVYGIGVQAAALYFRSDDGFAWFRDGVHAVGTYDPGAGGTTLMTLNPNGNLTVTSRSGPAVRGDATGAPAGIGLVGLAGVPLSGQFGFFPAWGVQGTAPETNSGGVFGEAMAQTTETWGVRGRAHSSSGYGAAGENDSTFGIGVYGLNGLTGSGAYTPSGVYGESTELNGNGVVGVANTGSSAFGVWGRSTAGEGGHFSGGQYGVYASSVGYAGHFDGAVQINYSSPFAKPQLQISEPSDSGFARLRMQTGSKPFWDIAVGTHAAIDQTNSLRFFNNGATGGDVMSLSPEGHLHVRVITVEGGADLAEPFKMSGRNFARGAVVVIDEENPGQLKLSTEPYDTRVAGVISGAGGVKTGLNLQQRGVMDGDQPVALSGRVYVQAEASSGAIKPGDLLTTSETAGHAMRVVDHTRAQGAIIGKAMSGLREGKGLVLVLVTLQ